MLFETHLDDDRTHNLKWALAEKEKEPEEYLKTLEEMTNSA